MTDHPFSSNLFFTPPPFYPAKEPGSLRRWLSREAEQLVGLHRCAHIYHQIDSTCGAGDFSAQALKELGVSYEIDDRDLARIPTTGPCILIANHPFGGIEGLALFALIAKIRPDFKVMANYLLARIPQLQGQLVSVNPFGGTAATRTNLAPLRQALNWLKQGGLLVLFPAGEVSSWQSAEQGITDPAWSATLPRLVRLSGAPVLPVYFPGHNGALFNLAGRVHPRLRTLLLPRMILNKQGHCLEIKVGQLVPTRKLSEFSTPQELNDYLRLRTYALAHRPAEPQKGRRRTPPKPQLLPEATDPAWFQLEIDDLSPSQRLVQSGEFDVVVFRAVQGPKLLQEIGRLRELTFRAVGEGTGQSIDLDPYDQTYEHLLLWNRQKQEVVGAYRIGQVDRLLAQQGAAGLYTSTLFNFKPAFLGKMQNSLELGRSFVRPEYQRSYAPLLLLWKGVGRYLVANPHYRYLFGPVSISADYSDPSRQLITSTLTRYYLVDELAGLVSARLPVPLKPLKIAGLPARTSEPLLRDMEEISALVADLEADSKGIPVLLRHYLGLGGKLLAFNLDPAFSDVIDGLLLVDLQQTNAKQLQRYMGERGYQHYFNSQLSTPAQCA
jgi:putative hemolysin